MRELSYDQSAVHTWERDLRAAFECPRLVLTRRPQLPVSSFTIEMAESSADTFVFEEDGSGRRAAAQVRTAGVSPNMWFFSFAARFDFWRATSGGRAVHRLEHASLSLSHRVSTDDVLPSFRADWDPRAASDANSEHAQPHWHFTQLPERIEDVVRRANDAGGSFEVPTEGSIFAGFCRVELMHFAMCAVWHRQKDGQTRLMFESDRSFNEWLGRLTRYVAGQLRYVSEKSRPNGGVWREM